MNKVLIISGEPVQQRMAGPGIRFWEFAQVLSRQNEVTLSIPNRTDLKSQDFDLIQYDAHTMARLLKKADVILCGAFMLSRYPALKTCNKPLVVDIYAPLILEGLESFGERGGNSGDGSYELVLSLCKEQLLYGDFFICANRQQRDFWLGMLVALNRVTPFIYERDKDLKSLIDIVPFGLSDLPPQHTKPVLKGTYKTIGKDDKVLLWGGGIYEWLDPFTLLRAMKEISRVREDVKLVFPCANHPNADVRKKPVYEKAVQFSKELGLFDKYVFFLDWIPYTERHNYLLEADVGLSLHHQGMEAAFSFRTRILDYIWAGLPMIVSMGDVQSEMVEKNRMGLVVECGDERGVREAIFHLLDDHRLSDTCRQNVHKLIPQSTWSKCIRPLSEFCLNPVKAMDKGSLAYKKILRDLKIKRGPRLYFQVARDIYSRRGLKGLSFQTINFLKRRML